MKKNIYILFCFIIILGCKFQRVVKIENLSTDELELWMINNSKEIQNQIRYHSFKISNPKNFYREELIRNKIDSLGINSVQQFNIDKDKNEDLIVYGRRSPYLIINKKEPTIIRLRKDPLRELIAHYNQEKEILKIHEIEYLIDKKYINSYDLTLWKNKLIEISSKPNFKINEITYHALNYENRFFKIDMEGRILLFDYKRDRGDQKSKIVKLKKGKSSKSHIKNLCEFFEIVNIKEIIPNNIDGLHVQNVILNFKTSSGYVEIRDQGKKGTYSLISLYEIFENIINTTKFEVIKEYDLDELYEDNFEEIKKIFKDEN